MIPDDIHAGLRAIGPCELGRKGWEPCTPCGRMASTYCAVCDIRICPSCFTSHRKEWENSND